MILDRGINAAVSPAR